MACAVLPNDRRVHVRAHADARESCWPAVQAGVAGAELAVVMTWSGGSRSSYARQPAEARPRRKGLEKLAGIFSRDRSTYLLLNARGSRCADAPAELGGWLSTPRAACIDGPNIAARESHTVLSFCADFYDALPRAILFAQDDPEANYLTAARVGSAAWLSALEAAYDARAARPPLNASSAYDESRPWELPCPCQVDRESNFEPARYGYYRSISWFVRTFFAPFAANASRPLPKAIACPRHAQFAVPRRAVWRRSRAFWRLHAGLSSLPAPLKHLVPRVHGATDADHARAAKWANFGRYVVDLGELAPRRLRYPDNMRLTHGMTLAMMYERLWFRIFDPALPDLPLPPDAARCFDPAALAIAPVRCVGATCPHAPDAAWTPAPRGWAGCATAAIGEHAPHGSPGRCLADGCVVAADSEAALGPRLWRERRGLPVDVDDHADAARRANLARGEEALVTQARRRRGVASVDGGGARERRSERRQRRRGRELDRAASREMTRPSIVEAAADLG